MNKGTFGHGSSPLSYGSEEAASYGRPVSGSVVGGSDSGDVVGPDMPTVAGEPVRCVIAEAAFPQRGVPLHCGHLEGLGKERGVGDGALLEGESAAGSGNPPDSGEQACGLVGSSKSRSARRLSSARTRATPRSILPTPANDFRVPINRLLWSRRLVGRQLRAAAG